MGTTRACTATILPPRPSSHGEEPLCVRLPLAGPMAADRLTAKQTSAQAQAVCRYQGTLAVYLC